MDIETPSFSGELQIRIISNMGYIPIGNATVKILSTENTTSMTVTTDSSGETENIVLPAPNPRYTMAPSETQPYTTYDVEVEAEGYEPFLITGVAVYADTLAIQVIRLIPLEVPTTRADVVNLPPHTLFGNFHPKIPEDEIKPLPDTGQIVLSRVVIPEFIIVHDGDPNDASAPNYWVRYKDYIKNVASCEIYSTWPEATLYANILAIMSFTLNRVYTEWYRSKGFNFTITSSTAYDHKWNYGQTIYSNIDRLVDSIFANYLSRPGVSQPIFTAYCDGRRVTCNGLSQWGSKYLGDEGYSAIEIIRYYFGNDMYINTAETISGVPSSFPGYNLSQGATGEKVRTLQNQLNRIARNYPAIPTVTVDGIYGPNTAEAVRTFQEIFDLPPTGITDYPTWYEISDIYVGVTRIAEPM